MKKIRVFSYSDGADYSKVIFTNIADVIDAIKEDLKNLPDSEEREYTIEVKYMSKKQIQNLPEACI